MEPCPKWYRDLFAKVIGRVLKDFNFKGCKIVKNEDGLYDIVDP